MPTEENKIPETEIEKEETPEWAKNLQNSLDSLKDLLTPNPTQENQPQEIPVPEPLEQEPVEPEMIPQPQEPENHPQEPEKPKKRKFLDWLL